MKEIKTISDLSNAWAGQNATTEKLRSRPYVAGPALQHYLDSFENLKTVSDPAERFELFRMIPAFEFHLKNFHDALNPQQRRSLAQQERAKKPRIKITGDGKTMQRIVSDLVLCTDNRTKIAKQLWPLLFGELRKLRLHPTKLVDPDAKESCVYDAGAFRRTITERRFANIVSSVRRAVRAQ